MKPGLVIDFDGTLVDPAPRDYQIYCDVMEALGHSTLPFESFWKLRRESTPLSTLLNDASIVEKYVETRRAICENDLYLELNVLFDDVDQTIRTLCEAYELHLVSARYDRMALLAELDSLRIRHRFTSVLTTISGKLDTIKKLDRIIAVIGDTEHDIEPAKALGIKAIGLTTGIRSRQFLESIGADIILDRFSEVPHALGTVR